MPTPTRIAITSACRTPIGAFCGSLSPLTAPQLGSVAVRAALERSAVAGAEVSEVILGQVLSAGVGQAPARQAALTAGIPDSVPALTINKVCGSGLKAVMLGAQAILTGDAKIVVAGGMESMSNAPYLLDDARSGYRLGHRQLVDSILRDGLWDVYNDFHMGAAAELCARECGVSRAAQDEFAARSYRRALAAQEEGHFNDEIVPVDVEDRGRSRTVAQDEGPATVDFDKLPKLRSVFQKDGTVTAANASSINDGAAACVLMTSAEAARRGLEPLAELVAQTSTAKAPEWFTTAPADAIQAVLVKAGLELADVDLFEINEAFAVVNLAVGQRLGLDEERVNVSGGAVALGHPIGASGARILTTLLHGMRRRDDELGVAAICLGGGEASAVVARRRRRDETGP